MSYNSTTYTVTLELTDYSWNTLPYGNDYEVVLADSVTDNQGNQLDGTYTGSFPTGRNRVPGNFYYQIDLLPVGHTFATATPVTTMTVDGATQLFSGQFNSADDVNVFSFTGTADEFVSFAAATDSGDPVNMDLFVLNSTLNVHEQVASYSDYSTMAAYQLPQAGTYYMVIAAIGDELSDTYILSATAASSDTNLEAASDWQSGTPIAYVTAKGTGGANLGGDYHKQLVYINFNGGTTTQYASQGVATATVSAFSGSLLDSSLSSSTKTLETDIVNNIMSIYENIPSSYGAGACPSA